ncbi:hypothetical protein F511_10044 [Dorcoceras hygrometricum]|uniref:Uncharacterized protein n=1 Tax=Dorcoceras hygrometricum TaxID=472368 RepID=A0A2Z7AC29_9LAMI|nr:hypothetical protein F511_10044 [Dorcoceras hygrometricum]
MRIRPPELETSICDVKYHVSFVGDPDPPHDCCRLSPIRSTTRSETPSSGCTRSPDEISPNGFSTSSWPETNFPAKTAAAAAVAAGEEKRGGGGQGLESRVRL